MKIGQHEIDNRWIVPYCPLLAKTFNAHINVEFCNSVKSIKYVCKYVNKGSDAAMFALQETNIHDEITQYEIGRYISSNEAFWRIFGFPIHERHPAIQQLAVHLENGQRIYFTKETAAQQVQAPKNTTLTAFLKLCQEDEFARTLFYHQVPSYYTWSKDSWNKRKRGAEVQGHPNVLPSTCSRETLLACPPFPPQNLPLFTVESTLSTPSSRSDLPLSRQGAALTHLDSLPPHDLGLWTDGSVPFSFGKAAPVFLPTALSVALRPLFPFQQAQYV